MANVNPPRTTRNASGPLAILAWLAVPVGGCILAIHSFSGEATESNRIRASAMTGATLSALHSSISGESASDGKSTPDDSPATF